ncbi:MAG: hypothetical protein ACRDE8_06640 [Ginsengibacter sp.]
MPHVGASQNNSKNDETPNSNDPDSEPDKGSNKGFTIWIYAHLRKFDTTGKKVYQTSPFYNDSSMSVQLINGGSVNDTGKVTIFKTLGK